MVDSTRECRDYNGPHNLRVPAAGAVDARFRNCCAQHRTGLVKDVRAVLAMARQTHDDVDRLSSFVYGVPGLHGRHLQTPHLIHHIVQPRLGAGQQAPAILREAQIPERATEQHSDKHISEHLTSLRHGVLLALNSLRALIPLSTRVVIFEIATGQKARLVPAASLGFIEPGARRAAHRASAGRYAVAAYTKSDSGASVTQNVTPAWRGFLQAPPLLPHLLRLHRRWQPAG